MPRSTKPAYLMGCDAAEAGKTLDTNPFPAFSDDRESWLEGFYDWTSEFGSKEVK